MEPAGRGVVCGQEEFAESGSAVMFSFQFRGTDRRSPVTRGKGLNPLRCGIAGDEFVCSYTVRFVPSSRTNFWSATRFPVSERN